MNKLQRTAYIDCFGSAISFDSEEEAKMFYRGYRLVAALAAIAAVVVTAVVLTS